MRSILILGKKYVIEELGDDLMQGLRGSAKRTMQKINISTNQGPDSMSETLLHEVLHIIDGELVLGLTGETIARLAVGLYSAGYRRKGEKDE
jgi:hypothetical protein